MKLPFGKYKGEELEDIEDISYLKWLEEQDWLRLTSRLEIQHEIKRREGEVASLGKVRKGGR